MVTPWLNPPAPPPTPVISVNPGLIGDKIAHGAILADLRRRKRLAFGVECADDTASLTHLCSDLIGAFTLSSDQYNRPEGLHQLFWSARSEQVISPSEAYETKHTATVCPTAMRELADLFGWVEPLWDRLSKLSGERIWPAIEPSQPMRAQALNRLRSLDLEPARYIILHTRSLSRDPERNLDQVTYLAVAEAIHAELGLACLWIGADEANGSVGPHVRHLDARSVDIEEMAALLAMSRAFVGGDSGPLHLAAASGTFVVAVERVESSPSDDFGPYCDPAWIVRLGKSQSDGRAIVSAIRAGPHPAPTGPSAICQRTDPGFDGTCGLVQAPFFSSIGRNGSSTAVIRLYRELLAQANVAGDYMPFRTRRFTTAATFLGSLGVQGFSVGAPFKLQALRFATSIDEVAASVGAVNTLVRAADGKGWRGSNTDAAGFDAALTKLGIRRTLAAQRVLILGSGGGARACSYVLRGLGAEVSAWSRNPRTLQSMCRDLAVSHVDPGHLTDRSFALVVNATGSSVEFGSLARILKALDWPSTATFLDLAVGSVAARNVAALSAVGISASDGWEMLTAQGALQVEHFAGLAALGAGQIFQAYA